MPALELLVKADASALDTLRTAIGSLKNDVKGFGLEMQKALQGTAEEAAEQAKVHQVTVESLNRKIAQLQQEQLSIVAKYTAEREELAAKSARKIQQIEEGTSADVRRQLASRGGSYAEFAQAVHQSNERIMSDAQKLKLAMGGGLSLAEGIQQYGAQAALAAGFINQMTDAQLRLAMAEKEAQRARMASVAPAPMEAHVQAYQQTQKLLNDAKSRQKIDPRLLLGYPSEAEMSAFTASLKAQMGHDIEDLADSHVAAYRKAQETSQKLLGEAQSRQKVDPRALIGMPSEAEMAAFSASLRSQMTHEAEELAAIVKEEQGKAKLLLEAQARNHIDARTLLGLPTETEMHSFTAQLRAQMQAAQAEVNLLNEAKSRQTVDPRQLIGAPSREEMKSFGSSLKSQMLREAEERAAAEKLQTDLNKASEKSEAEAAREAAVAQKELASARDRAAQAAERARLADERMYAQRLKSTEHDVKSGVRGVTSSMGGNFLTYGSVAPLMAGYAVAETAKQTFTQGADYDFQLKSLQAVNHESEATMARVDQSIRGIARETNFSPLEVAKGLQAMTEAGFSLDDSLKGLPPVLRMVKIGHMDIDEAVKLSTHSLQTFKLPITEMRPMLDVLGAVANKASVDIGDMGQSFARAATAGRAYGATYQEVSAMLGVLSDNGIFKGRAGTALTRMFEDFTPTSTKAKEAFDLISKINGTKISFYDDKGDPKRMPEFLASLNDALRPFKQETKNELSKMIFGDQGGQAALVLIDEISKIGDLLDNTAKHAADGAGYIKQSWDIVETSVKERYAQAFHTLSDTLTEVFENSSKNASSFANTLDHAFASEGFKAFVSDVASGTTTLLNLLTEHEDAVMGLAKAYLVFKGLSIGGSLLGGGIAAFQSFSKEVKATQAAMSAAAAEANIYAYGVGNATTKAGLGAAAMETLAGKLGLLMNPLTLTIGAFTTIAALELEFADNAKTAADKFAEASDSNLERLDKEIEKLKERAHLQGINIPGYKSADQKGMESAQSAASATDAAVAAARKDLTQFKGTGKFTRFMLEAFGNPGDAGGVLSNTDITAPTSQSDAQNRLDIALAQQKEAHRKLVETQRKMAEKAHLEDLTKPKPPTAPNGAPPLPPLNTPAAGSGQLLPPLPGGAAGGTLPPPTQAMQDAIARANGVKGAHITTQAGKGTGTNSHGLPDGSIGVEFGNVRGQGKENNSLLRQENTTFNDNMKAIADDQTAEQRLYDLMNSEHVIKEQQHETEVERIRQAAMDKQLSETKRHIGALKALQGNKNLDDADRRNLGTDMAQAEARLKELQRMNQEGIAAAQIKALGSTAKKFASDHENADNTVNTTNDMIERLKNHGTNGRDKELEKMLNDYTAAQEKLGPLLAAAKGNDGPFSKQTGEAATNAQKALDQQLQDIAKVRNAKFDLFTNERANETFLDSLKRQHAQSQIGMTTLDKQISDSNFEIDMAYMGKIGDQQAEIDKLEADRAKALQQKNTQLAETLRLQIQIAQKQKDVLQANRDAEKVNKAGQIGNQYSTDTSAKAGFQNWFSSFRDQAGNTANQVQGFMSTAFGASTKALEQFVMYGKADIKSLERSVLQSLLNIALQKAELGIAESFIGAFTGGGTQGAFMGGMFGGASVGSGLTSAPVKDLAGNLISVGTKHSGGMVGVSDNPSRMISAGLFNGAPRFHTGGIVGDEVPIIAKRGEGVFTPAQMAAMGSSGGGHTNNVVINLSPQTGSASAQGDTSGANWNQFGEQIGVMINQKLIEESRPGGVLYNQQQQARAN